MIKKNIKVIVMSILIGVSISLFIILFFIKISKTEYHHFYISSTTPTEDVKKLNAAYEKNNAVFEEKINGLNGRCTDIYVIIGIIVTLFLAINIGVFVSAQHEAHKYFNDNFSKYEKESKETAENITKIYQEALEEFAKIKTMSKLETKETDSSSPEPPENH